MVSFIISLFIAVSAENGIETSRIPELDFWYEGLGMLSNATIKNWGFIELNLNTAIDLQIFILSF